MKLKSFSYQILLTLIDLLFPIVCRSEIVVTWTIAYHLVPVAGCQVDPSCHEGEYFSLILLEMSMHDLIIRSCLIRFLNDFISCILPSVRFFEIASKSLKFWCRLRRWTRDTTLWHCRYVDWSAICMSQGLLVRFYILPPCNLPGKLI